MPTGRIHHNAERELIHDWDAMPSVLPVYHRDLEIEKYFIGYLQHPYVSFYTGRGCPAKCTLLPLAADHRRPCLPHQISRRGDPRDGGGQGIVRR